MVDKKDLETKIIRITESYSITENALTEFRNLFLRPIDREKALHSLPHHLSNPKFLSDEKLSSSYLLLHYRPYMNNTYVIDHISFTNPKQKTFDRLKRLYSVPEDEEKPTPFDAQDYSSSF